MRTYIHTYHMHTQYKYTMCIHTHTYPEIKQEVTRYRRKREGEEDRRIKGKKNSVNRRTNSTFIEFWCYPQLSPENFKYVFSVNTPGEFPWVRWSVKVKQLCRIAQLLTGEMGFKGRPLRLHEPYLSIAQITLEKSSQIETGKNWMSLRSCSPAKSRALLPWITKEYQVSKRRQRKYSSLGCCCFWENYLYRQQTSLVFGAISMRHTTYCLDYQVAALRRPDKDDERHTIYCQFIENAKERKT